MKRLLLTTVALTALASTSALAADIPARVTRAPAMVTPICTWCGFYIGFNAGFAWGEQDFTFGGVAAPLGSPSVDASGFTAGGQVGYNWQFSGSPWVVGIEADIQGAWIDETRSAVVTIPGLGVTTATARADVDYFGTVRGRLGYAWANWMAYVTGGWAYAGGSGSATITAPGFAAGVSGNNSRTDGWTVGGGVEGKFAPNWSAKLEYLYVRFDGDNFATATPIGTATLASSDLNIHVFRVGVNYHFGTFR